MLFWFDCKNWDNWDNWNNWDNWANFTPGSIQYNVVTSKTDTTTEQTEIDPPLTAGGAVSRRPHRGQVLLAGFSFSAIPLPSPLRFRSHRRQRTTTSTSIPRAFRC